MDLPKKLDVMILSGVEDGIILNFDSKKNGTMIDNKWKLSIGRRDENDICLKNDTFISRVHAFLIFHDSQWWLEDNYSTNGTFHEPKDNSFLNIKIYGTIPLELKQHFRIGRTWLRIQ